MRSAVPFSVERQASVALGVCRLCIRLDNNAPLLSLPAQAFPYYASVFTTMAGFFVLGFFFLYHK